MSEDLPHGHINVLWRIADGLEHVLTHTKAGVELIYEKRAEVWADLVLHGVEQKDIATRAGVDPSDVSRALSTRGL